MGLLRVVLATSVLIILSMSPAVAAQLSTAPPHLKATPSSVCFGYEKIQGITQRRGISCSGARAVQTRCVAAGSSCRGMSVECRGRDKTRHWRGWTIVAMGRSSGKIGVGARWSKGAVSFVASGGGTC